ncbi:hypothetical protein PHYBLDRAFT_139078 [Phycomyces blakesleeanus NRRL 1555(-)]|uniref:Reverse transcriptase domain-containing protein n=1 Tax=Phycomyces blakesleeanus (strain ATCC 8743b / DSM 1359 / FGSC 10004 / NBRC 33097 / NRRL 1555) TaxID=763407 RepID=A0A162YLI7_PHYB8|nr:hypothetical protein PHYBLDRAFT_139078 [Phycomyces blakesleeanus NRRL 1555(-)]OAD81535.1 hypothetical protein PHYBLDRAFT_139078 [Phycomyces blakesleeanus NRRL 1555(-)]|eukprot:XP_018299575.1 hypothetical protein PHYBLDRAFT_139078 [Phycomyces blakesleeanus NRRL 1555(-)]
MKHISGSKRLLEFLNTFDMPTKTKTRSWPFRPSYQSTSRSPSSNKQFLPKQQGTQEIPNAFKTWGFPSVEGEMEVDEDQVVVPSSQNPDYPTTNQHLRHQHTQASGKPLKDLSFTQVILVHPSEGAHYVIPEDGIAPGGRLQHFQHTWEKMTKQTWPQAVVQEGYQILFKQAPIPWRTPQHKISQQATLDLDETVQKFLLTQVIEESPNGNDQYLSKMFVIQEKDKKRLILDCQKINSYVQLQHFKMKGVPALRDMVTTRSFMTKIDLKDTYLVVPIHKASRQFLSF